MLTESARRHLPYTPRQLFDVVADIEKYPEFLPWFAAVRVLRRHDGFLEVEQVMRFRMFRARFVTTARLERPRQIDIASTAWPFRSFKQSWVFSPAHDGGTEVELTMAASLRSRVAEALAAYFLGQAVVPAAVVACFERRAHQLYRDAAAAARAGQAR